MGRLKSAHGPYPTRVAAIESASDFADAVAQACALLRQGELVALPTETVYGLAANALNPEAVAKIFEVKGRPAHNPIIVHAASLDGARACAREWPETAARLAQNFWPGPLTLVLPRSQMIPDIITGGGPTVGIRWPSHPFMQAVILACGFPLAAPSANLSNQLSPTNAAHVRKALDGKIRLIVDGGQSQVGIESTVVDLASSPPRILRPGMIQEKNLAGFLSEISPSDVQHPNDPPEHLRSPGLLSRHYSPRARLAVLSWENNEDLHQQIGALGFAPGQTHVLAHERFPDGERLGRVAVIPYDAEAYARALYGELHASDDAEAALIVIESPPADPAWQGIFDRITRAARRG